MKNSILLCALMTLLFTTAQAAVVKGHDSENACDLYRVVSADTTGKIARKSNEVIVYAKEVYGLSFQDMEINFDKREVLVQPIMNIVMGLNRPLIPTKAVIPADHEDFNFLINQLNRKLYVFEKICIDDGKIVYAKMFETENK